MITLVGLVLPCAALADFGTISAPFSVQRDLITGISDPRGIVDDGSHIFVDDNSVSPAVTYRFTESGGSALSPDGSSANGLNYGLAIQAGHYYGISRAQSGIAEGVWEFNPTTLARVGASPIFAKGGLIQGLVADPLSGDLYVGVGLDGVYRIQNPAGTPVITHVAGGDPDGLAFDPAGQHLWVADVVGRKVTRYDVDRSLTMSLSNAMDIGIADNPDGLAIPPAGTVVNGIDISGNVYVNTNQGNVKQIDVHNGNAVTNVASAGARGDLAMVDHLGYMDVTQQASSSSVIRLVPDIFSGGPHATKPPYDTRITKAKINKRKHTASFTFTAAGTVSGFQCALVKTPKGKHGKKPKLVFTSCSSTKTYKHLNHGRFKFEVRAVNSVGPDPRPAIKDFSI